MRGKVFFLCLLYIHIRITPAYAGKSCFVCVIVALGQDHPRVCGEKYSVASAQNVLSGSPPRMRGKAKKGGSPGNRARITPAYAGKSIHALLCVPAA